GPIVESGASFLRWGICIISFSATAENIMLELRPNCECCDKDLPPAATDAMICTFECTFCRDCVNGNLGGRCPNCGGNFAPRPIRPAAKLRKTPPPLQRIFKPQGCGQAA